MEDIKVCKIICPDMKHITKPPAAQKEGAQNGESKTKTAEQLAHLRRLRRLRQSRLHAVKGRE